MAIGIVGKKAGMTRVFTEAGQSVAVTVLQVTPNRVTQVKTPETDGYSAVQIAFGEKKASRVSKPQAGQFAKANVEAGKGLIEFRTEEGFELGQELTVEQFEAGQKVDVTGTTKGKGFQGGVKRWNFSTQDATHGNSLSHRAPGSIGQCQTPGRVWKGKKMAGHMGAEKQTTQMLEIVQVDAENNLLLIKGAVPGATGSEVIVKPAVKAKG
ncbi:MULTISPECIES: 50S ribosomal protein L3 [Thalassolituus]|jgi:large subunit ribosomal protein L3|uniref:50S ribosomal protein L3 n=1 Tax=Thalassolituus TaxID=187492 RepID=UPI0007D012C4|nr:MULTISPECIES: 50S ribosomal protein L3 [Thalassolituus]KZY96411.1 50S ribosomal protein L3 [Oleibacter sp. HI0075]MAX87883.1 50S ribosomal protein L3 [Oceanospirillaceae bacterium]MEE3161418.1 50S ribosomal protein L3 [Pseudomonadota bacterium]HCG80336.1 50S ribosomal protein L3 [Oceanospirillales bacterium]KZZ04028.1 50S ribosomal protein L3 [Oleibacter sp. HI0075]|tara:strand:+ start:587 stop:1219 length:633 start_codon:yes stop_codon:yes gene_type:complete